MGRRGRRAGETGCSSGADGAGNEQFSSFGLIADELSVADAGAAVTGRLKRLCAVVSRRVSAAAVGVSVMVENGSSVLRVAEVSGPAIRHLGQLPFTVGEGPCFDAFVSRSPVLVPDLVEQGAHRWPMYTPAVSACGIEAVFAFPLQAGRRRLGVLDVLRMQPGPLTASESSCMSTFADAAVVTLLQGQLMASLAGQADELDGLCGQAEVFQAQGMMAVQLGVSVLDALARMRAHAFTHGLLLADVARDVVARRLRFDLAQN